MVEGGPAGRQRPRVVVVVKLVVSYYRYVNLILRTVTALRQHEGKNTMTGH